MLVNHGREKLLNAILYFAQNVNYCGRTKLFKLLYLLDFTHYKQTGRSVTGQYYAAWDLGPVPELLYTEMEGDKTDLTDFVDIKTKETPKGAMFEFNPKPGAEFNGRHFSRREKRILQEIAEKYKNTLAKQLIALTHEKGSPWDIVYNEENNKKGKIPYSHILDGLDKEDRNDILEMEREHEEMLRYQAECEAHVEAEAEEEVYNS